jgi:hypothetical protein
VLFLSCEPELSLPLEDFEFEAVVLVEESLLEPVFELLPESLVEELVEAVDEEPPELLPLEVLEELPSEAVCDDLFESLEPPEDLELVEAVDDLPSVDLRLLERSGEEISHATLPTWLGVPIFLGGMYKA